MEVLEPSSEFEQYEFSQNFKNAIKKNKLIAAQLVGEEKEYFEKHAKGQSPKYMWIGCSDSRVIPEKILGLEIG